MEDAELLNIVSQFNNASELWNHFGYQSAASYTKYILPRLRDLGFEFGTNHQFADDLLREAAKDALSVSDVCRSIGVDPTGRGHNHISKRLDALGIGFDTQKKFGTTNPRKRKLEEYLVCDGPPIYSSRLKKKLITACLLEEKCAKCNCGPVWLGQLLVLQLDHINGNNKDNRLKNLRLLCPNCHSQTPTYAKRKR